MYLTAPHECELWKTSKNKNAKTGTASPEGAADKVDGVRGTERAETTCRRMESESVARNDTKCTIWSCYRPDIGAKFGTSPELQTLY